MTTHKTHIIDQSQSDLADDMTQGFAKVVSFSPLKSNSTQPDLANVVHAFGKDVFLGLRA